MDKYLARTTLPDSSNPGARSRSARKSVYKMNAATGAGRLSISRRGMVGAVISAAAGIGLALQGGAANAETYETKPACSA